jgi:hypothetical protein
MVSGGICADTQGLHPGAGCRVMTTDRWLAPINRLLKTIGRSDERSELAVGGPEPGGPAGRSAASARLLAGRIARCQGWRARIATAAHQGETESGEVIGPIGKCRAGSRGLC